jgi:hypothetical protein
MKLSSAKTRPIEHEKTDLCHLKRPSANDNLDLITLVVADVSVLAELARANTGMAAGSKPGRSVPTTPTTAPMAAKMRLATSMCRALC